MSLNTAHIKQPIHLVTKLLTHTRNIVITTHVNPDGDAIGSACAMLLALRHQRKNVTVINVSQTPKNLRFLPGAQDIQQYESAKHDDVIKKADMILCLDFNTPKRINEMEHIIRASEATKVMIDHHTQPEDFYSAAIHDVDATSTGELIYKLLATSYPEAINSGVAANLYAAMMTDSGNFRFPRVSSETHTIIADLLQRGADPVSIYEQIFNTSSMPRMLMLGEALASMTLHHNGKLCVMTLTHDMFQRTGCSEDDTEGFVHNTLSIEGVVCGLLIVEKPDEVKCSFRSKGNIPANLMAGAFGGGGHVNAAGARIKGASLEELRAKAIKAAGAHLH
ncbi:MAG: bifunctional oligoribonuclease/PAP phosphatase NrnA [Candidatus Kapabacteria bacterium]|nr:bifunctional oligoribonuclease/PAP phosphatase NrnA [Candidatus Kapabacteria bacterium]